MNKGAIQDTTGAGLRGLLRFPEPLVFLSTKEPYGNLIPLMVSNRGGRVPP